MTYHHSHHVALPNPLDIAEMAKFDDTLDGESVAEQRRKQRLYLRDAGRKIKSGREVLSKFKFVFIPFAIIPIFWPFLFFAYHLFKKQKQLHEAQFSAALEYWTFELSDLQ